MDPEQMEEFRRRYLADQVATASPERRLLMLFESLLRDLHTAQLAFEGADLKAISDRLIHAQEIIGALRDPLDRSSELGRSLDALYGFCLGQLVRANFDKNPALLPPVIKMIEQVANANRIAYEQIADADESTRVANVA